MLTKHLDAVKRFSIVPLVLCNRTILCRVIDCCVYTRFNLTLSFLFNFFHWKHTVYLLRNGFTLFCLRFRFFFCWLVLLKRNENKKQKKNWYQNMFEYSRFKGINYRFNVLPMHNLSWFNIFCCFECMPRGFIFDLPTFFVFFFFLLLFKAG